MAVLIDLGVVGYGGLRLTAESDWWFALSLEIRVSFNTISKDTHVFQLLFLIHLLINRIILHAIVATASYLCTSIETLALVVENARPMILWILVRTRIIRRHNR